MVQLGTNLPEHLIGTDAGALAEFLTAIEDLGYSYVTVGDHVLGADAAQQSGGQMPGRQSLHEGPVPGVERAGRDVTGGGQVEHPQHGRIQPGGGIGEY